MVLLLLCVGWVVVRGLSAVTHLQAVKASASQLRADVTAGDLASATAETRSLAEHAASARDLTADPIWRAFEIVPWLGSDFTTLREVSQIADDIAADGVEPILTASERIDLKGFGLHDGAIDLAPFAKAQKPLSAAATAFARASADVGRIDTGALLPPLADAVSELRSTVDEANGIVGALHDAASLIPSMLGGDGPRTYVIAMLNNAELRSDGGIVGALAVVQADHGSLSIAGQASTADFPALADPLPLSASTTALFGDGPGRYIQNISSIPDFAEAAPLLATRWQDRFGSRLDGVVAIDTVVAKHLLRVTGPQQVGQFRLDSDNVLHTLLSDVYRLVPDPRAQDAVFAGVAGRLFTAVLHSQDPRALITAMADAAEENRIRLWSAHDDEQRIIAASALGGALPRDTVGHPHVGVLINDTTGGKMDYYAKASITVATGVCHGDPTTRVSVTWTSTAPADAASSLSEYVTGGGHYGVEPGSIGTRIAVYGPAGATPTNIRRDGVEENVQTADLDGRIAIQHGFVLTPGASSTITVDYIGKGAGIRSTDVVHTPMASDPKVSYVKLSCAS